MPKWISAFDRVPEKYGKYFVKLNGPKDVLRLEEFHRAKERYDEFFWLDENLSYIPEPAKKETFISALKSGRITERHIKSLTNLLGVKETEKITNEFKKWKT